MSVFRRDTSHSLLLAWKCVRLFWDKKMQGADGHQTSRLKSANLLAIFTLAYENTTSITTWSGKYEFHALLHAQNGRESCNRCYFALRMPHTLQHQYMTHTWHVHMWRSYWGYSSVEHYTATKYHKNWCLATHDCRQVYSLEIEIVYQIPQWRVPTMDIIYAPEFKPDILQKSLGICRRVQGGSAR